MTKYDTEKIKRSTVCQENNKDGLNLININSFEWALKLSQIDKLLSCTESQWYKLFKVAYTDPNKLIIFGDDFSRKTLSKIKNQFWENVIGDWACLCHDQKPKSNSEILQSCI